MKVSGAFRSWLWKITSNKIRDQIRRNSRQTRSTGGSTALQKLNELPDAICIPEEEPSEAIELQQLVARGLAQVRGEFETRSWAIFERSVVDQLTTEAVAAEFGVSSAAVRQVRSRVLRRLRQQLGDLID